MSKFGWDLPPGCTQRHIDEAFGVEGPCEICGRAVDDCICPECPTCGAQGDPKCYADIPAHIVHVGGHHNLRLSLDQEISRAEAKICEAREQLQEIEMALAQLKEQRDHEDAKAIDALAAEWELQERYKDSTK